MGNDAAVAHGDALLEMALRVARLGAWWVELEPEPRLHWSGAVYEVFARSGSEPLTLEQAFDAYVPEDRPRIRAAFEACVREGTSYDLACEIVDARGKRIWTRSIGEAVRDASNRIVGVRGAFQDLSAERAEQRRFRELADAMPFIVWSARPDGEVDYSNRLFFEYTGVSRDAPQATRWQPCVHPEDLPRCMDLWTRSIRAGVPYELELRLRRGADGAYRRFRLQAVPVCDGDAITSWYGVALDIDDASRLAERLRATLESVSDAFLSIDERGRVTYANAVAERVLGRPRDELLGEEAWTLPPIADTDAARELRRALAERAPVTLELFDPRTSTWLELRAYPSAEGLAIFGRDVTELRKGRDALGESEARFRLLARATNDAIWDWDLTTSSLWWNDGFEALFGFSPEEVEPDITSWEKRLHPDDRQRVVSSVHAAIDGGAEAWSGEYRFLRKDGSYAWAFDRGHVIRDASGKGIRMVGGMTDVTERKRLEQQLLRAQRLESVGTLAGGIAHDLNNVLSPILTSISHLREAEKDPERLDDLRTIESSARRGADMVQQLLLFARGDKPAIAVVDLGAVASDVVRLVRETFPKNITASLASPERVWPVRADATQLHQVLMNLCVNARDAMPDGGVLSIVIENVVRGGGPGTPSGPFVHLRVADDGCGIPTEHQDRIFEPFFTTKEVGKGTGLGLSTTHAIVRDHGGFIQVESAVGDGTRFDVYLPAQAAAAARAGASAKDGELPRGRGELVLVVDDEAALRKITGRTLERYGYRVVTAENGAEAVSTFAERRSEIALVLTDMSMPVMDGPATIAALRGIDPHVKIVGASGHGASDEVAVMLAAGGIELVPKPYTASVLLETLRRVLG